jgi:hypothetical protein
MLANGQCDCQCDCGHLPVVRRQHLVSGSTTSCGCRKAEVENLQQARKHRRS